MRWATPLLLAASVLCASVVPAGSSRHIVSVEAAPWAGSVSAPSSFTGTTTPLPHGRRAAAFLLRRRGGSEKRGKGGAKWPYLPAAPPDFRSGSLAVPEPVAVAPLANRILMVPIATPGPPTVSPENHMYTTVPPKGLEGWYHTLAPQLVPGWAQGATDYWYRYFMPCFGGPDPCPYTMPPVIVPITTTLPPLIINVPVPAPPPWSAPAPFPAPFPYPAPGPAPYPYPGPSPCPSPGPCPGPMGPAPAPVPGMLAYGVLPPGMPTLPPTTPAPR
jgi:hypothetical protein